MIRRSPLLDYLLGDGPLPQGYRETKDGHVEELPEPEPPPQPDQNASAPYA